MSKYVEIFSEDKISVEKKLITGSTTHHYNKERGSVVYFNLKIFRFRVSWKTHGRNEFHSLAAHSTK